MRGREYPDYPMVGVGAVIFNTENQILLIRRGKQPSQGLWALPGGLVEIGEESKEAAKREVNEECNIDIEISEVVSVVDLILKDHEENIKYHYVLIDYYAKYVKGNIEPKSDALDAKWFRFEELDELDIPEVTRQVIEKAFKK